MKNFFDFIVNNYEIIVTCISCFITIIIFILKNKHNKDFKKIFRLLSVLPVIINEAENVFTGVNKSGIHKLTYVLEKIDCLCNELNISYDEEFWQKKVEELLSTPQKK